MAADLIVVSAISFFEIAQKVRLGKWPEMAPQVGRLPELLASQNASAAPLEVADCLTAGTLDWSHRDPFDRFLAATALRLGVSIVSADSIFDNVVQRVW